MCLIMLPLSISLAVVSGQWGPWVSMASGKGQDGPMEDEKQTKKSQTRYVPR